MSNRSRAAYYAQIDRVYSNCAHCLNIGARYSKHDGQKLCKECRAKLRNRPFFAIAGTQYKVCQTLTSAVDALVEIAAIEPEESAAVLKNAAREFGQSQSRVYVIEEIRRDDGSKTGMILGISTYRMDGMIEDCSADV